MNFSGKKVTVMGLGLYKQGSGIEAVKFFLRQGAAVTVTDLRSAHDLRESVEEVVRYWTSLKQGTKNKKQEIKSLRFVLGRHNTEDFRSADLVFQNPSVPAHSPYLRIATKRKIPIVNDWSLFLSRHTPKLFIGVTGTRGKSTTTALIYEMLKLEHSPFRANRRMASWKGGRVLLAGNLGMSPLAFIDTYKGEPIVAELSSWLLHHFPTVKKSPNIAVVLNIMNDHMDKYKSMREYMADKESIFRFQAGNVGRLGLRRVGDRVSEYVVLNYDNPYTRAMAKRARGKVLWFSLKRRVPRWVPLHKVALQGEHNLANALAAAAAAEAAGVSRVHIIDVLKTFKGLPNRMQLVRTLRGVQYYNDTTATTPEATIAGLKTLGQGTRNREQGTGRSILICGGADKKLNYRELAKYVKKYCKAVVLLPGTATKKLESGIRNQELRIVEVKNMKEAVRSVARIAVDGDIVLLSPAAASFGLFLNEFDRGDQYVAQVKKL